MPGSSSGLPCLTVLGGPMAGSQLVLEQSAENILIGSDPSCRFHLPLPGVSPIHARLWIDASGITVYDTHSPRGLHINDDRVNGHAPLRNGDILWLGTPGEEDVVMIQCKFPRVQAEAAEEPSTASPEAGDETLALESPLLAKAAPPPTTILESDFDDSTAPTQFIHAEDEGQPLEVVPDEPLRPAHEDAAAFAISDDSVRPAPAPEPPDSPTVVVAPSHLGSFEDETVASMPAPEVKAPEETRPFQRPPELKEDKKASAPAVEPSPSPTAVAAPPPPLPTPPAPRPAEAPRPAARAPAPRTTPAARPESPRPTHAAAPPPQPRRGGSKPPYALLGAGVLALLVAGGIVVALKFRAPVAVPSPSPVIAAPTPVEVPTPNPPVERPPETVVAAPTPSPAVEETVTIVKPPVPSPKVAAAPSTPPPTTLAAKPSPSPKTASPAPAKPTPPPAGPNPAEQAAAQVASLLGQADAAVAARKYADAAGLYDQALKLDPQNQRAAAGKTNALGLAAGPRRVFAAGRTSVTTKDAKADLSGFDSADVKVAKAPDYSGIIEFEVAPPNVKPGDNYTVRVVFTNDGKKAFKINAMTVTTTANGARSGGPTTPRVRQVASQQKVTLEELPGVWAEGVNSWVMEVVVTSDRGDTFKNQLAWR